MGVGDENGGEVRQLQPQLPQPGPNAAAGDPGVHQQVDVPAGEHQRVPGGAAGQGMYSGQRFYLISKCKSVRARGRRRKPPSPHRGRKQHAIIDPFPAPEAHGSGLRGDSALPNSSAGGERDHFNRPRRGPSKGRPLISSGQPAFLPTGNIPASPGGVHRSAGRRGILQGGLSPLACRSVTPRPAPSNRSPLPSVYRPLRPGAFPQCSHSPAQCIARG